VTEDVGKRTYTKICLACEQGFLEHLVHCPNDGTTLMTFKTGEDTWEGKVLDGRYRIDEQLGKGGIGIVYRAHDMVTNASVALKMLQEGLDLDPVSVRRFEQEVKATSHLHHEHLVEWRESGIAPTGQPYLVLELLSGRSLWDELKKNGPLSAPLAVHIFCQAAEALQYCHEQDIVHRDLKPSNIVLINCQGDPDFVKIADFGLAKLTTGSTKAMQRTTKTGEFIGSPIYISPEQAMGKVVGPASDIYSLGVTLFESITGKPPFLGKNSVQTVNMHIRQSPPRPSDVAPNFDIPAALDAVVMKALQKEPGDRFHSMTDFAAALQGALNLSAGAVLSDSAFQSEPEPPETETEPSDRPNGIKATISSWFRRFNEQ
jgi:serine/threonine-protein kinase